MPNLTLCTTQFRTTCQNNNNFGVTYSPSHIVQKTGNMCCVFQPANGGLHAVCSSKSSFWGLKKFSHLFTSQTEKTKKCKKKEKKIIFFLNFLCFSSFLCLWLKKMRSLFKFWNYDFDQQTVWKVPVHWWKFWAL